MKLLEVLRLGVRSIDALAPRSGGFPRQATTAGAADEQLAPQTVEVSYLLLNRGPTSVLPAADLVTGSLNPSTDHSGAICANDTAKGDACPRARRCWATVETIVELNTTVG